MIIQPQYWPRILRMAVPIVIAMLTQTSVNILDTVMVGWLDPSYAVAEFLDDEFKEENVEIVVSMAVKGKYQDTEHVKFKTLPAVKVASCIIKGSYDQMVDACAAVISWIKENGYKMNGPMFNIYHVSPAQTKNPEEYVTEACFPIE